MALGTGHRRDRKRCPARAALARPQPAARYRATGCQFEKAGHRGFLGSALLHQEGTCDPPRRLSGARSRHDAAHRARPWRDGERLHHHHEPCHADRAGAVAQSRVSSENGRPSRLRQRIQAQDHPYPGGRGAVAYPADPRLPRRRRSALLPQEPGAGRPQ